MKKKILSTNKFVDKSKTQVRSFQGLLIDRFNVSNLCLQCKKHVIVDKRKCRKVRINVKENDDIITDRLSYILRLINNQ